MLTKVKKNSLSRMSRIVGQAQGIRRMIEQERYCPEIVQQITAVRAALAQVGMIVLRGHLETCVSETVREGREDAILDELDEVLTKFLR
ncbi:MAG: metal-sensing transcriptional repressor [Armatimonadetes bacterium]|nr:metal-sensing transcriptional repressor [Armatimonadota bacterium]